MRFFTLLFMCFLQPIVYALATAAETNKSKELFKSFPIYKNIQDCSKGEPRFTGVFESNYLFAVKIIDAKKIANTYTLTLKILKTYRGSINNYENQITVEFPVILYNQQITINYILPKIGDEFIIPIKYLKSDIRFSGLSDSTDTPEFHECLLENSSQNAEEWIKRSKSELQPFSRKDCNSDSSSEQKWFRFSGKNIILKSQTGLIISIGPEWVQSQSHIPTSGVTRRIESNLTIPGIKEIDCNKRYIEIEDISKKTMLTKFYSLDNGEQIHIKPDSDYKDVEKVSSIYDTVRACQESESNDSYFFKKNNLLLVKVSDIILKDYFANVKLDIIKNVIGNSSFTPKSIILEWPLDEVNQNYRGRRTNYDYQSKIIRALPEVNQKFLLPINISDGTFPKELAADFKECYLENTTENIKVWSRLHEKSFEPYSQSSCDNKKLDQSWLFYHSLKNENNNETPSFFIFLTQNKKSVNLSRSFYDGEGFQSYTLSEIDCQKNLLRFTSVCYESKPTESVISLLDNSVLLSGSIINHPPKSIFYLVYSEELAKGDEGGMYPHDDTLKVYIFEENKFKEIWRSPKNMNVLILNKNKVLNNEKGLSFIYSEFKYSNTDPVETGFHRKVNCTMSPTFHCKESK